MAPGGRTIVKWLLGIDTTDVLAERERRNLRTEHVIPQANHFGLPIRQNHSSRCENARGYPLGQRRVGNQWKWMHIPNPDGLSMHYCGNPFQHPHPPRSPLFGGPSYPGYPGYFLPYRAGHRPHGFLEIPHRPHHRPPPLPRAADSHFDEDSLASNDNDADSIDTTFPVVPHRRHSYERRFPRPSHAVNPWDLARNLPPPPHGHRQQGETRVTEDPNWSWFPRSEDRRGWDGDRRRRWDTEMDGDWPTWEGDRHTGGHGNGHGHGRGGWLWDGEDGEEAMYESDSW